MIGRTLPVFGMVAALLSVSFISAPTHAQTARSGGAANALLLQQMQQLASERTSLQAENAKMKQELDAARKERDTLKNGQQALAQRNRATAAALQQANNQHTQEAQQIAQTKAEMQALIAKFRETIQQLKAIEAESTSARQATAVTERQLNVCMDHDVALYNLDVEVLSRADRESGLTRLARMEPFTQIGRARLENRVDDYKARANDLRVKPVNPAGPAPAVKAPQPAAPPAQATSAPGSGGGPPHP
jgi:chromosome segregation ATPase